MIITRGVSLTNFLVASSALGFQVFVLYPWHQRLDEDFEALKKEHIRVLRTIEGTLQGTATALQQEIRTEERKGIREQLSELKARSIMSQLLASAPVSSDVAKPTASNPVDKLSGLSLYARYAFAGAVCCSFTHAIITPIDVIKTRIQLDPAKYNRGMFNGLRQIAAHDGPRALLTGFGPTVGGYFVQGAFKFGGYEFFKQQAINWLGHETASKNRHTVYLTSSAVAEFLGDIALCPFEAVRIRLVSEPTFARGMLDGFFKMGREEGIRGLYSGLGPILLKQVPYTMATFVVYENVSGFAYKSLDKSTLSDIAITGINLGSGLIAGIAAALVSQPADTMLSKINKSKGRPGQGTIHRLYEIARELGIRGSYAGIRARLVMVGGMTAGQFAIYGHIKKAAGATGGVEL